MGVATGAGRYGHPGPLSDMDVAKERAMDGFMRVSEGARTGLPR
jgi:hypothetical protein